MNLEIKLLLENIRASKGASSEELSAFESSSGIKLPVDYREFLEYSNGAEGSLGNKYVVLWPVTELIQNNAAYQVNTSAPGLLLFGSDGGGEAYAFDLRSASMPIVQVPFIPMSLSEAQLMAPDFDTFLRELCSETPND